MNKWEVVRIEYNPESWPTKGDTMYALITVALSSEDPMAIAHERTFLRSYSILTQSVSYQPVTYQTPTKEDIQKEIDIRLNTIS